MHILSGKAYARAVRAHLLVDAALNALFLADAFQVPQILVHQEVQTAVQENERNGRGTVSDFAFPPMQGPDLDVMDGGNISTRCGTSKLYKMLLEPVCAKTYFFAHALGGSDTTSSLFTISKSLPLRKVRESQVFWECAHVFTTTGSSRENSSRRKSTGGTIWWKDR